MSRTPSSALTTLIVANADLDATERSTSALSPPPADARFPTQQQLAFTTAGGRRPFTTARGHARRPL